ncbi:MAG TPA: hypothetical protein VIN59_07840 [Alphaproteobacteria bacterium]
MSKINSTSAKQQWAFFHAFDEQGTFPSQVPVDILRSAEKLCAETFNNAAEARNPYAIGGVLREAIALERVEKTATGLKLTQEGLQYRASLAEFIRQNASSLIPA